jgi:hypothetical protein
MSRTKHNRKPPGWDYWGKREGLGMGAGGKPSGKKKEKRIGIKRERAILKRELNKKRDEERD